MAADLSAGDTAVAAHETARGLGQGWRIGPVVGAGHECLGTLGLEHLAPAGGDDGAPRAAIVDPRAQPEQHAGGVHANASLRAAMTLASCGTSLRCAAPAMW